MSLLKSGCGALGLAVTSAHDKYGVALLSGAGIHVHEKVRPTAAAGYRLTQDTAWPHQRNTVGHGKVGLLEGLPVLCFLAGLNHVIGVDEDGIAALSPLNAAFNQIQGLGEVGPAHSNAQNSRALFAAACCGRYCFQQRHVLYEPSLLLGMSSRIITKLCSTAFPNWDGFYFLVPGTPL